MRIVLRGVLATALIVSPSGCASSRQAPPLDATSSGPTTPEAASNGGGGQPEPAETESGHAGRNKPAPEVDGEGPVSEAEQERLTEQVVRTLLRADRSGKPAAAPPRDWKLVFVEKGGPRAVDRQITMRGDGGVEDIDASGGKPKGRRTGVADTKLLGLIAAFAADYDTSPPDIVKTNDGTVVKELPGQGRAVVISMPKPGTVPPTTTVIKVGTPKTTHTFQLGNPNVIDRWSGGTLTLAAVVNIVAARAVRTASPDTKTAFEVRAKPAGSPTTCGADRTVRGR